MNRRSVLIATAGALAAAALPAFALAAEATPVAVFEADEPAARAFRLGRSPAFAVDGDRVRFARALFREQRPAKVLAMTRYADYLLLTEAAREDGYRIALVSQADTLFTWTAERA